MVSRDRGVPVGLFGAQRKTRSGCVRVTQSTGAGPGGEDRVHRVGGNEAEHRAPRPAEGLQHLLEDLVGAVAGPDVLPRQSVAEVPGECFAELRELAVGVAVDRLDGPGQRGDDVAGDRLGDRMRVLVDVEGDRNV
jgi:hypothetical protein